MKSQHIAETDLALYVSGDLSLFRRVPVGFHVRRCERCRGLIERYRADRGRVKEIVAEMPEGLNWDRLSREMGANIRVGSGGGRMCGAVPCKTGPRSHADSCELATGGAHRLRDRIAHRRVGIEHASRNDGGTGARYERGNARPRQHRESESR